MKKIYLSVLSLAVVFGASAQKSLPTMTAKHKKSELVKLIGVKPIGVEPVAQQKAVTIWSDDMTTEANWIPDNSANTGGQTANWTYTTDPSAYPSPANTTLNPFLAPTANTGFWYVDSDGNNTGDNQGTRIDANLTLAPSQAVNLSVYPNVILQFTSNYRWFEDERTVSVSGDNGLSWTDYNITIAANPGGFDQGYSPEQNTANPEVLKINVSAAVGGASQVLVRFNYDDLDVWGWYWAVDEVSFLEQPLDDVQLLTTYIIGTTNNVEGYGRIPLSQVPTDLAVGADVHNLGTNDQPTTNLVADFGTFTSNSTASIDSDSIRQLENVETPVLTIGTYTGNYAVTAGTDMLGGAEYANNTVTKIFEVTPSVYSLDGIGVSPTPNLTSFSTNTFDNSATTTVFENSTGVVLLTPYDILNTITVSEIEVLLGSNTTTGGDITLAIIDTATLFASPPAVTPPLGETINHSISAADVTAGVIRIPLQTPLELTPNLYYAMATLNVYNPPSEVISILDDGVVKTYGNTSLTFAPEDFGTNSAGLYGEGEAYAIRLITGTAGLDENSLNGVEVYPNPTTGKFTVTNENNTENTVAIFDVLGKQVYTNTTSSSLTVDLSANGMGVYLVKVSNENGSIVKRVVIK